mmetsp:Transcript_7123/g.16245  ORF Transcript_7123/g.16245 Transcript_7123/m.16245 type:complete len:244 (-) Transcript_7123:1377-2108(-)
MTTGVSADPIAVVMCAPRNAASPNVHASAFSAAFVATAGAASSHMKYTLPTTQARLTRFFMGRATDLDGTKPDSLPKATIEPVKVSDPINVPAQIATLCPRSDAAAGCAANDAMLVTAAARPTSEWNAATSWGRSVMATRAAMIRPTAPPPASTAAQSRSAMADIVGTIGAIVAATPSATPDEPSALPRRAVSWLDKPQIAPMQRHALVSPTMACMPAVAAPLTVNHAYTAIAPSVGRLYIHS